MLKLRSCVILNWMNPKNSSVDVFKYFLCFIKLYMLVNSIFFSLTDKQRSTPTDKHTQKQVTNIVLPKMKEISSYRMNIISHLRLPSSFFLAGFSSCERGLHGFSVQWQRVLADVHVQPQRQLLPTFRSRGWWESVQWHHLAVDCCAGDHRQHRGGGGGLRLRLLTQLKRQASKMKQSCTL